MAIAKIPNLKNDECYTPKEFVARFGDFDYDPATTKEKAQEFKVSNFDTIETDGLSKDWTKYSRIWINPPFTRKYEFLKKAWETYKQVKNEIYILFPIDFLTTKKFHSLKIKGRLFIPEGRIKFETCGIYKGTPAFGSVVMKLQDNWGIELIDIKPTQS